MDPATYLRVKCETARQHEVWNQQRTPQPAVVSPVQWHSLVQALTVVRQHLQRLVVRAARRVVTPAAMPAATERLPE